MFISQSIMKEINLEEAVLFDGRIEMVENERAVLTGLNRCLIYELSFNLNLHADSPSIVAIFTMELDYDIMEQVTVRKGIRKLSVKRNIPVDIIDKDAIGSFLNRSFYLCLNIDKPSYKYSLSEDRKSTLLKVTACLRGYILSSHCLNLYRCIEDKSVCQKEEASVSKNNGDSSETKNEISSPMPEDIGLDSHTSVSLNKKDIPETIDWKIIMKSLNLNDILTVFENLISLIKTQNNDDLSLAQQGLQNNHEQNDKEIERIMTLIKDNHYLRGQLDLKANQIKQCYQELLQRNSTIDKLLTYIRRREMA